MLHHPVANFITGHTVPYQTSGKTRTEQTIMIAVSAWSSRACVVILHTGGTSIVLASLAAVVLLASWLSTVPLSSRDKLEMELCRNLLFFGRLMHSKLVHEESVGSRSPSLTYLGHNNKDMQRFSRIQTLSGNSLQGWQRSGHQVLLHPRPLLTSPTLHDRLEGVAFI